MSIPIACKCGKRFQAKDELAGKRVKCPVCAAVLTIPAVQGKAAVAAKPLTPATKAKTVPAKPVVEKTAEPLRRKPAPDSTLSVKTTATDAETSPSRSPIAKLPSTLLREPVQGKLDGDEPTFVDKIRDRLYLILILGFIPLVIATFSADSDAGDRLREALDNMPEETVQRLEEMERSKGGVSADDLIGALPDHRVPGAHLARNSGMHWVYAALSAAAFLGLTTFMFSRGGTKAWNLILVGLFTATIGIFFLLAVQYIGAWAQRRVWIGFNVFTLFFYIAKFLGFSYRCAIDPQYGFWVSLFGFTFGVGLCEEFCKGFPMLWRFRQYAPWSWKKACLWGLASGAGFGVAEGISYSSEFYNGIGSMEAYVIRFVSCVALHAVLSASVGLSLYHRKEMIKGRIEWTDFIMWMLIILSVPMVLHGLYDTLLKKEMPLLALLVALGSFVWLAYQIESTRIAKSKKKRRKAAPAGGLGMDSDKALRREALRHLRVDACE